MKKEDYLKEGHRCENCGNIITEWYGSGRFCSVKCARSFSTKKNRKEVNAKVSKAIKGTKAYSNRNGEVIYLRDGDLVPNGFIHGNFKYFNGTWEEFTKRGNPRKCQICGKIFFTKLGNKNKTCSNKCYKKLQSINSKRNKLGGYKHFSGSNISCKGYYNGIYCDSTYELAYVIYNLENNINFKRCERVYEYTYKGEKHKYHPDFELEDGTIIEIKGYVVDKRQLNAKIKSVKDRKIKVLYKKDLQYVFDYIKQKYGNINLKTLYDK